MKIGICGTNQAEIKEIKQLILHQFPDKKQFQIKGYLPNEVMMDIEEQVFDRNIMILNTQYRRQETDGIRLGRKLNAEYADCQLIYISDNPEIDSSLYEIRHCYLIQREHITDYLEQAVQKALRQFQEQVRVGILELVSRGHRVYIRQKDILYIERQKREVEVVTRDRKYTTYESLQSIATRLEFPLMRCHAGYIVNLAVVDCIAGGYLVGIHGLRIPIGRTYAREVRQEVRKMAKETKEEENAYETHEMEYNCKTWVGNSVDNRNGFNDITNK